MSSLVDLEPPIARTRRAKAPIDIPLHAPGAQPKKKESGPQPILVTRLRRPEKKRQPEPRRPAFTLRSGRPAVRIAQALVIGTVVVALAGQIAAVSARPVVLTYHTGAEIR